MRFRVTEFLVSTLVGHLHYMPIRLCGLLHSVHQVYHNPCGAIGIGLHFLLPYARDCPSVPLEPRGLSAVTPHILSQFLGAEAFPGAGLPTWARPPMYSCRDRVSAFLNSAPRSSGCRRERRLSVRARGLGPNYWWRAPGREYLPAGQCRGACLPTAPAARRMRPVGAVSTGSFHQCF